MRVCVRVCAAQAAAGQVLCDASCSRQAQYQFRFERGASSSAAVGSATDWVRLVRRRRPEDSSVLIIGGGGGGGGGRASPHDGQGAGGRRQAAPIDRSSSRPLSMRRQRLLDAAEASRRRLSPHRRSPVLVAR
eukprot:COSAG01_NODE_1172_length_11400_cov_12.759579_9_plen_133_part_00